jgi:glycogen(starch) synthase
MRILMVNRGIFRVPLKSSGGGAEKHGYYLADHLAMLGHEVHFVSKTGQGAEFHPRMRVSRVPPERAVIPPQIGFFGWTMKHLFGNILCSIVAFQVLARDKYRFDVIHCHGALSALLLRILTCGRIPIVYTMHDASPWIVYYPGLHKRAIRKAAYLAIDIPCLRAVSRVIAVSPALREEAKRLGCTRAEAIPTGIRSAASSEGNPSCQVPYGLFVGQLVPRKGVDLLVRAAVKLQGENIRFVVVGDGPERLRLAQLAQKLRVSDRVTFTGYVSDANLASHYSNASFFVFPSSAEGFPIVVLEAMSYALPVVAAKASVYGGVLVDGVNSLIFNGGDIDGFQKCVKRMISDSNLRKRLTSGALSFAQGHLSWEAVARRVLRVYEEVSTRRSPSP